MYSNGMDKHSPSYNEALFESMTSFLGAVWEIDLPTSKVKIMHDIYVPKFIGATWSFSMAKSYLSRYAYPEDKAKILGLFDKSFLGNLRKSCVVEARAHFNNSEPHLLRCSLTPYFDKDGNPKVVYASFAEIEKYVNENTGAEYIYDVIRERDESKKELRQYLSAVSCGIIQYKRDSKELLFVNDVALEILGYSSKEHIQREGFSGIAKSVSAADITKITEAVNSLKNENDSVDFEYHVHRSDGKDLLCLGKARLLFDEKGEAIIQRSMIDITESSKTRDNYLQTLENLNMVNDVTDSALWYLYFDEAGEMTDIFWSQRYRYMLGYENEEDFPNALDSWLRAIHPDDKKWVLEKFNATLAGKGLSDPKFRLQKKDGSYIFCSNSARIAYYPNGKIRLIVGIMLNVTEQENEQRDINGRLDVFLGGVKGGLRIIRYAKGFPYVYVSKNLCAIQGYTEEEFLNVTNGKVFNNIRSEDKDLNFLDVAKEFKSNQTYHAKYRVQHKDGHWLWVSDYGKLVTDTSGNRFIYSLVQDIDEQESVLLRLAAQKAKYAEALTKNSVYNFSLDLDKGLIEGKVQTFKGTDLLEKVGLVPPVDYDEANKRVFEIYNAKILTPDGERIFSRAGLVKNFMEGKTTETVEYYLPEIDMYIRAMSLLSKDPVTGHLMASIFALDITEEKKEELAKERALKEAFETAERANKAKTVFLNSMSHDIRTPMNAIIGFTNLASSHIDDKELVADYLAKIKTSSDHLLSLINDVLDMSHIESGKVKVEELHVSLLDVVEDIENIVQPAAEKGKIDFCVDVQGIRNSYVLSDKLRLNQVLLNCISNSIKYTPSHGKVNLRVVQIPCDIPGYASYRFIVSDNGIGMSQEFVDHIFEPFTREATSTASGIQGTGLGMAITKNIVEMMGGSITCLSEQGFGTEITINLSFRIAYDSRELYSAALRKPEPSSRVKSLDGISILLVEDNELNREIAEALLMENGATVDCVTDGYLAVEVLKKTRECRYDVVLMDVQMPIMDGYEATKKIRMLPNPQVRDIPIIAMTANAFEEDRKLAFEAGMNEHLPKPIVIENVLDVISSIVRK
mgnify:CR=1 FL=1